MNFLVEKEPRKAEKYLKQLQKNVDKSEAVTVISDATKEALESNIDLRGTPVKTIYNGVKLDSNSLEKPPQYLVKKKYFFAIGVFKRKKNFEVLLPMMKYFPDHQLVIAGINETDYGNFLRQQIEKLNLKEQIILPGKVGDEEKSWLYHHCEAFMMPSQAEGFGLPVIEAMLAEKPVFLNNISSLSEIGGNLAYYFESFDAERMAELISKNLLEYEKNKSHDLHQLKTYAEHFNWHHCINEYLKLYREILNI